MEGQNRRRGKVKQEKKKRGGKAISSHTGSYFSTSSSGEENQ